MTACEPAQHEHQAAASLVQASHAASCGTAASPAARHPPPPPARCAPPARLHSEKWSEITFDANCAGAGVRWWEQCVQHAASSWICTCRAEAADSSMPCMLRKMQNVLGRVWGGFRRGIGPWAAEPPAHSPWRPCIWEIGTVQRTHLLRKLRVAAAHHIHVAVCAGRGGLLSASGSCGRLCCLLLPSPVRWPQHTLCTAAAIITHPTGLVWHGCWVRQSLWCIQQALFMQGSSGRSED